MGYREANHRKLLQGQAPNGIITQDINGKTREDVENDYDAQIKVLADEVERLRAERDTLRPRRSIYDAI